MDHVVEVDLADLGESPDVALADRPIEGEKGLGATAIAAIAGGFAFWALLRLDR